MNKSELIEHVAKATDLSKAAAARALDGVLEALTKGLKAGHTITLVGFGTFRVSHRAARKGRNPQTGKEIMIKATKVPTFRAGKALKEAVNKGGKK